MAQTEDAKLLHDVVKDPNLLKEVQAIARDQNITFNKAMKVWYKNKPAAPSLN